MAAPGQALAPRPRPRRADARRNRELLLAAAMEVFGASGTAAPLDEIARRAGVGNATMYRHFPTRQDLVVAVYADEVAALCARGASALTEWSPADALFGWLAAFIEHVAAKRELALASPDDPATPGPALFGQWHEAMRSTADTLVARARRAGAVRADVAASDLLTLANGIALAGMDEDGVTRLLRLIRRGVAAAPEPDAPTLPDAR